MRRARTWRSFSSTNCWEGFKPERCSRSGQCMVAALRAMRACPIETPSKNKLCQVQKKGISPEPGTFCGRGQVAGGPSLPSPESRARLDSVLQCQKRTATKDYQFQDGGQISRGLIKRSTFPPSASPGVAIDRTISRDLSAGSVSYTAPNLK